MLAGWKFDARLSLAGSKMEVRLVLRNRFVGIEWFTHIDQQMVMAAVFEIIACMSYPHVAQAKAAPESALDRGGVLRPHEIQKGILRRRLSLGRRRKRQACQSHRQRNQRRQFHETSL